MQYICLTKIHLMNRFLSLLLFLVCFSSLLGQTKPIYLIAETQVDKDTLTLSIRVYNFIDIQTAQFGLLYDTSAFYGVSAQLYPYGELNSQNALISYNNFFNSVGFTWFSPTSQGLSLPNDRYLFSVKFIIKNPRLLNYCFDFYKSRTAIEFTNTRGNLVPAIAYNSCDLLDYSYVYGDIILDKNANCIADNNESKATDFTLKFTDTNAKDSYVKVDDNGHYGIILKPGTYNISLQSDKWNQCINPMQISTAARDRLKKNILVKPSKSCPDLFVDITAPFLRLCRDNNMTVSYNNLGTIPQSNAYIVVTLDEALTLTSASINYTSLSNNQYRFDIGDVMVHEVKNFTMSVKTPCDISWRDRTLCSRAEIFPKDYCTANALWSKAELDIRSNCVNGNVIFDVTNVGRGDMNANLNYAIIEDDNAKGYGDGNIKLKKNETKSIFAVAKGKTIRILFDTIAYDPYHSQYTAAREACGSNANGSYSKNFITKFSAGDEAYSVSTFCDRIITSFDPNDKSAVPEGAGKDHVIQREDRIHYTIRFQNTGNDTAFRVLVIDTLSPNLDLASLLLENASHPYTFINEHNGILKFDFKPIYLVDSTKDEKNSHGFIKYSIKPLSKINYGSFIENRAAIYFDFNPPVLTNSVIHSIARPFVTAILDPHHIAPIPCKIYPNPFQNKFTIEIPSITDGFYFELHDLSGLKVYENVCTTQIMLCDLSLIDLNNVGIFQIRDNKNKIIHSGKLLQQK